MTDAPEMPERVNLRDAGIHETEGRRIITNVGMGYVKTKYIRTDLYDALKAENERMKAALIGINNTGHWQLMSEAQRIARAALEGDV